MATHTQNVNIFNRINNLVIFKSCDSAFLDSLVQQSKIQTLKKGQILFLHEDRAERFFIITKGWIKLFRETLDGTQAVIDILTAGHVFGETAIFQDNLYPYSAEATEPTEIISFPLPLLKKEIKENQKLTLAMLSSMASYRRQQDQELEHRTLQNAPQRIGCFLLRLANQQAKGKTIINLPYDKTLVASRLGMQPETFSRALNKLKIETGIEVEGASIKVNNLTQLSQYACSACSSEFPCKDLKTNKIT
jgi:CRP-like cAMP-binding protein